MRFVLAEDLVDFFLAVLAVTGSLLTDPTKSSVAHRSLDVLFQIKLSLAVYIKRLDQELHHIVVVVGRIIVLTQILLEDWCPGLCLLTEKREHIHLLLRQGIQSKELSSTHLACFPLRKEILHLNQRIQGLGSFRATVLSEEICDQVTQPERLFCSTTLFERSEFARLNFCFFNWCFFDNRGFLLHGLGQLTGSYLS